jgi:hypothetical protein
MPTEKVQQLLMFAGALTLIGFAFLLCCVLGLVGLLIIDGYQARQKSKYGKHLTAGSVVGLPTNDDLQFFDDLSEKDAEVEAQQQKDILKLREDLTGGDKTVIQAPLRSVPGWLQEGTVPEEETMVYPFNMKGETLDSRERRH